jgi:hypothetical protein
MAAATTAREALLADLIGDVAHLLGRLETLVPVMDEARRDLAGTTNDLAARAQSIKTEMEAMAGALKLRLVEHVAQRTAELAEQSVRAQNQAMANAARAAFETELAPTIRLLASRLQVLAGDSRRERAAAWPAHLLTAAVSASSAVLLMTTLFPH